MINFYEIQFEVHDNDTKIKIKNKYENQKYLKVLIQNLDFFFVKFNIYRMLNLIVKKRLIFDTAWMLN